MSDSVPFKNINPEEAAAAPNSPFLDFWLTLKAYVCFDAKTKEEVFIWQLWNKYKSRKDQLALLSQREHNKYVFIKKEDWK